MYEEPADTDLCHVCGHDWDSHKWIVYTQCDTPDCDCRYFVSIPSPEYQAECAERVAWMEARAAKLATMTEEETQQLLKEEYHERNRQIAEWAGRSQSTVKAGSSDDA